MATASEKRDARLRKLMLRTLFHARSTAPTGAIYGTGLMEEAESFASPGDRFEGEGHAIGLLRDLEAKGLVEVKDARTRRSQMFALSWLLCRITAKGISLKLETIPPDPDIDDERNMGDA